MSSIEAKLLDIIIPVYNKQEFLFDLTNSLATLCPKSVNVIFVDDGSTDQSLDTLESNRKDNFFIYSKENGGVSSARNYGLKLSKSKYIWFFDPDDRFGMDVVNIFEDLNLYEQDILVFNYTIKHLKNKKTENFIFDNYGTFETHWFARKYNYFSNINNMSFIWNKFYKRDFILNFSFDENVSLSEDRRFNLEVFNARGSVNIVNKLLYEYYVFEGGTLSTSKNIKKVEDVYATNLINIDFLGRKREYVKKHIMEQVIFRSNLKYGNLYKFYKKEHENFGIEVFPFFSLKDLIIYTLLSLGGINFFLKIYHVVKLNRK